MRLCWLFILILRVPTAFCASQGSFIEFCTARLVRESFPQAISAPQGVDVLLATPRLLVGSRSTLNRENPGWLTVFDRRTLHPIGSLAINVADKAAHLPLFLDRLYRLDNDGWLECESVPCPKLGRGLGSELKYAALFYAFHVLKVENIYAATNVNNERSQRLHRKLGFERIAASEVVSFPSLGKKSTPPWAEPQYWRLTRSQFIHWDKHRLDEDADLFMFEMRRRFRWRLEDRAGLANYIEELMGELRDSVVKHFNSLDGRNIISHIVLTSVFQTLEARERLPLPSSREAIPAYYERLREMEAPLADARLLLILSRLNIRDRSFDGETYRGFLSNLEAIRGAGMHRTRWWARQLRRGTQQFFARHAVWERAPGTP